MKEGTKVKGAGGEKQTEINNPSMRATVCISWPHPILTFSRVSWLYGAQALGSGSLAVVTWEEDKDAPKWTAEKHLEQSPGLNIIIRIINGIRYSIWYFIN